MTHRRVATWMVGGVAAVALSIGVAWAADLWGRLGVRESQAKSETVRSLTAGSVPFYLAAKAVMAAPSAARAALVVEGLTWAKAFAGTAEFKAAYAQTRNANKPDAPVSKGTPDQQAKAQQDEQRKQIEEMKKSVASMPPELRAQMEQTVKELEAQLKQQAADPKMQELTRQMAAAGAKDEQDQYQRRLADWERDYPAEPSVLVSRRLKQYLDTCADIDYTAKLTSRNGKMYFADQRYESKPSEWKLCYRVGRETLDATRTFARAWLAELTRK